MFSSFTALRAACVAALALTATPALSDTGIAFINWSDKNRLVVVGNGQFYTKLDRPTEPALIVSGRLEFDTNSVGRIKSWKAWPQMKAGYGLAASVHGLETLKQSKSYGVGSRPKSINKNLQFFIPYSKINELAVVMCNQKAQALRNQGQSNAQIFGKHHEVSFKISMEARVDSNSFGSGNQIWEYAPAFVLPVRCAKWSGAQIGPGGIAELTEGFKVLSATLKLQEQTTNQGVCRLKTVTALRTNKAGETIKYRFVHSSGQKSAVFQVKTAANKIAVVNHDWDVPNGPGPEKGRLQVEGVGTTFKSDKVAYDMNCKAGGSGGKILGGE